MRMPNGSPSTFASLFLCFALSGCASNEPSPAMKAWARQQLAEKQRLEASHAAQVHEVARLKAENERIKAQADADKKKAEQEQRQARAVEWVRANKEEICGQLTKAYEPNKQVILEAYQLEGKALGYIVDDVALEGNILYYLEIIVWEKADKSGGAAKILVSLDVETNKIVDAKFIAKTDIASTEFHQLRTTAQHQTRNQDIPPQSPWTPTSETVNSGYQAAIKVAATAFGAVLLNMLASE